MTGNKLLSLLTGLFLSTVIYCQEPDFRDSLEFYYLHGKYETAKFFAEKQVQKVKPAGEDTPEYAQALSDLATIYSSLANHKEALRLYKEAMSIQRKSIGEKNEEYATTLINIGNLYNAIGNYAEAESFDLQALKTLTELGAKGDDYAILLNNLAFLYQTTYDYGRARDYYNQALEIRKVLSGENSPEYALLLNNVGTLDVATGNYSEAEIFYKRALDIRQRVVGENHPDYAFTISNIASLYIKMGNYEAAEPLILKALGIRKKAVGENHPDFAVSLNNLANLYRLQRKYKLSDSTYRVSKEIFKTILGENHPLYAQVLNNLADVNRQSGDFSTAESVYKQALTILKQTVGEMSSSYAFSLVNLGRFYFAQNNYTTADSLFKKALVLYEQLLGKEHSDYAGVLKYRSNLYYTTHQFQEAEQAAIALLSIENKQLLDKLEFLSETELLAYLKDRETLFAVPYSLLIHYNSPRLIQAVYNNRLLLSGISIQNTAGLVKQMTQSSDSASLSSWNSYQASKSILNKTLTLPVSKRVINTDSLSTIVNQLEKDLLRNSAAYRNMKEKLTITWQDIKNKLKPGEAAIEFIRFTYFNKSSRDSNFYIAIVVRVEDTIPVFIQLTEEKVLKEALVHFAYKAASLTRSQNPDHRNTPRESAGNRLYKMLWQPLEPYLTNTDRIYFSPDGLLHQLAFAAIPYEKDKLLCEKYNLVQLTSTRQIAVSQDITQSPSFVALFGGVNYNLQATDSTAPVSADPYSYVYRQNRGANMDSFRFLPNTLKEVTSIKKKMALQKKKIVLFSGKNATEAAFRSISGPSSPEVIHFATHGFTLPDVASASSAATNNFKIADNPLLRCGIVLAGGNKGWKGNSQLNEDDGILTGLEITSVPLPGTRLVVLSACESGLGQLNGSEGVFGLQRAFKIAGADYIMATLWQIPDKETAEFMNTFYTNWLAGKSLRQSFITTQQAMRKKYSPYYWAAFTLVQ